VSAHAHAAKRIINIVVERVAHLYCSVSTGPLKARGQSSVYY
jgi:hypothetical protein